MHASVGYLVIDTTDPQRRAPFWCALLDVQVDAESGTASSLYCPARKMASSGSRMPSPARTGCT